MKYYKAIINDVERTIYIECDTQKHGREMVIFREVFPNGELSKMLHCTLITNVIDYKKGGLR